MSSSGGASSSAYRHFASGGRTPCTRCRTVVPEGETMEALPPSDGQPRWRSHRCFPACKQPPQPSASTSPNTLVFKQQFGGTPCTQCGKRITNGEMMQAEKTRGRWFNLRHVRCPPTLPASSRGIAATPTRLDMGSTKRPHSSLDGGGGSGTGSGSRVPGNLSRPVKRLRTPAGEISTAAPSRTLATRPWSQPTKAVAAAPRGGDHGDGNGVEVVRQVSVDERITENQRRQGVIDLGGDDEDEDEGVIDIAEDDGEFVALTPPSLPTPSTSAAGAAAKAKGGGGGGKIGGGISRNLAVTERWTERRPSA